MESFRILRGNIHGTGASIVQMFINIIAHALDDVSVAMIIIMIIGAGYMAAKAYSICSKV
jgi:hypothetical protein